MIKFKNKTISGFCSTVETRGLLSPHCFHFCLQIKSFRSKSLCGLGLLNPDMIPPGLKSCTKLLTKGLPIEIALRRTSFVTAVSEVGDYWDKAD